MVATLNYPDFYHTNEPTTASLHPIQQITSGNSHAVLHNIITTTSATLSPDSQGTVQLRKPSKHKRPKPAPKEDPFLIDQQALLRFKSDLESELKEYLKQALKKMMLYKKELKQDLQRDKEEMFKELLVLKGNEGTIVEQVNESLKEQQLWIMQELQSIKEEQ